VLPYGGQVRSLELPNGANDGGALELEEPVDVLLVPVDELPELPDEPDEPVDVGQVDVPPVGSVVVLLVPLVPSDELPELVDDVLLVPDEEPLEPVVEFGSDGQAPVGSDDVPVVLVVDPPDDPLVGSVVVVVDVVDVLLAPVVAVKFATACWTAVP
jgi:hypothetical protein